jgi:hypothetical protein
MWTALFRSLIWVGCAGLALTANACSSSGSGGDASATGGNATAGAGGAAGAAGGSTGAAGGSTGAAGGSTGAAGAHAATDASIMGRYFFTFSGAGDVAAAAVSNPTDTDKNDLSVFAATDGGPRAITSLDMTTGDPAAGSMELQLPCNAYGQFVDYQFILPVISDLGGKTLTVMIRLDSGFSSDATAPGNVYLYAKTGDNWDWGQGSAQAIAPGSVGQWIQYTFPMASPASGSTAMFDPGYVKAVGIHLATGAGAGASGPPAPAVFHIDSLGYE